MIVKVTQFLYLSSINDWEGKMRIALFIQLLWMDNVVEVVFVVDHNIEENSYLVGREYLEENPYLIGRGDLEKNPYLIQGGKLRGKS